MKVAMIDDTASNLVLLKEFLGQIAWCEPFSFSSPREALFWCEREEPDLVLVDYMMPELDGIEFIRRFRELPGREATPVVVITAYGEREVLYRALQAGANDFLTKPIDKKEFLFRMRNLLALRKRQNELAARAVALDRELDALNEWTSSLRHQREHIETELRQVRGIGRLAGEIAHDFNNVLTAISGYGSIIKSRLSDRDSLLPYAEKLLSSTERAARLTRNLLSLSRKQVLEPKRIDLNDVISDVTTLLLEPLCGQGRIALSLSGGPLPVMADASQIEQVLMNLAVNARDAMQDGGTVTIRTGTVILDPGAGAPGGAGPERQAAITVTDTGTGMDKDTQKRIFDPFFTTKDADRGTGLGLSIVQGIIRNHGGRIEVESEPGKGTSFTIFLPLLDRDRNACPSPEMTAR